MSSNPEIYEVLTQNNGRWTIQSRCRTEAQAVAEAREFYDRRQCSSVKVVKEAFDKEANLYREFTVFRLPSSAAAAAQRTVGGPANNKPAAAGNGTKSEAPKRRGLLEILTHRS